MTATRLLVALLAAPILILAVFPSAPWGLALVLAWDAAVFALALVGWAISPRRATLSARREVASVIPIGRPTTVTMAIENRAGRPRPLSVVDHPPAAALSDHGPHEVLVPPGSVAEVSYRLTAQKRGRQAFGPIEVRERMPFGLLLRRQRFQVGREVAVYPDFSAPVPGGLTRPWGPTQFQGRIQARFAAEGVEFYRLRPYRPGDDPRKVEWKASARHLALVTKEFAPERSQRVVIYVDTGRVMQGAIGSLTAMDYVVNAAVALARAAMSRGDLVGLLVAGADDPYNLPAGQGAAHLRRIVTALAPVHALDTESAYRRDLARLRLAYRRRCMVVVLTRVLDSEASRDLLAGVLALRPRHLPLVAAMADRHVDAFLAHGDRDEGDLARTVVASAVRRHEEDVLRRLAAAGCLTVHARAEAMGDALVGRYSEAKVRGTL